MAINSSTRAAIQKQKRALHASKQSALSIDTSEVRDAVRKKLSQVLEEAQDSGEGFTSKNVAKEIENSLHTNYKAPTQEYKSRFRSLYVSLKNNKTNFCKNLLDGTVDPHEFAVRSPEELKSAEQQHNDLTLREEAIRQSVGTQLLPESVNQIKDGRDREKWGVSRSAAAIDD